MSAAKKTNSHIRGAQTRMRFHSYTKYKPSGVEWIGNVPNTWDIWRLKLTMNNQDTKVEASEENPLPYIGLENIESWTGKILPISEDIIPSGMANLFTMKNVLFGKLRPYLTKACMPDFEGLCSTELIVLYSTILDRRYLFYLLLCDGFIKQVNSSTYGTMMPRANWNFIGNCKIAIPEQSEQHAIADFLDRETARIDALVDKKRTLIERLKEKRSALISRAVTRGLPPEEARMAGFNPNPKFKDSGVKWLGKVPCHWTIKEIKWETAVLRGASPRPIDDEAYFDENGEYAWVRISDVSAAGMYLRETTQRLSSLGQSLSVRLQPGSLFLSIAGTVGKPCITDIKSCIHDGFVHFPYFRGIPQFLYYIFASGEPYKGLGKLGTQLNLNTDTVGSISIGIPPKSEQRAIAFYLDRETAQIDKLIAKIETAIERLKEYRSALISAAVTGKIDVREGSA
jgi:type I restriction enzyme, S subunit